MPLFDVRRFWIRRDREDYLVTGLVITGLISSYTMAYWHKADNVNAYLSLHRNAVKVIQQGEAQVRETGLSLSRQRATTDKYYNLEKKAAAPEMPELGGDGE